MIDQLKQEFPVSELCRVLGVSRSGYYAWRKRPMSQQRQRREQWATEIREIHRQSRQNYGSPRVYEELKSRGMPCSKNTVAKIMRTEGIRAKTKKRFKATTNSKHNRPVAENVLDRKFQPAEAKQAWTADITYVLTREGWLYLAAVEDLRTRKIVGWSMSPRMTSDLVVDALRMAIDRELPGQGLIAHSDRGSQYASEAYQRLLQENEITCSMSRQGNCWDNAPMESFFATLKKELVHHEDYQTRDEARSSIFEYIEVFYNRRRRHSAIGYLTPEQFALAA
jgi:putative transposase